MEFYNKTNNSFNYAMERFGETVSVAIVDTSLIIQSVYRQLTERSHDFMQRMNKKLTPGELVVFFFLYFTFILMVFCTKYCVKGRRSTKPAKIRPVRTKEYKLLMENEQLREELELLRSEHSKLKKQLDGAMSRIDQINKQLDRYDVMSSIEYIMREYLEEIQKHNKTLNQHEPDSGSESESDSGSESDSDSEWLPGDD